MHKYVLIFILFFYSGIIQAQRNYTISGYVRDASTGEELIGANVYIEKLRAGSDTNVYGFYSVTIPEGDYIIRYSYIGYETQKKRLYLDKDIKQNIELSAKAIALEDVVVTGEAADDNVKSVEMSAIKMNPVKIRTIPILFGEQDILKTIQLMPGVKSAGEGNTGYYVRAGKCRPKSYFIG